MTREFCGLVLFNRKPPGSTRRLKLLYGACSDTQKRWLFRRFVHNRLSRILRRGQSKQVDQARGVSLRQFQEWEKEPEFPVLHA
jgi:hypothetical protein